MKAQTACRASLPAHYGNGAIEESLRTLRQALERRSWTFRKLERMNVLLGLMRLHHNGVDQFHTYTSLIRAHLEGHDGPARHGLAEHPGPPPQQPAGLRLKPGPPER